LVPAGWQMSQNLIYSFLSTRLYRFSLVMLSAARAEPRDASASRNIPTMPISTTPHQGVLPKNLFPIVLSRK
jgi:hypothetical protein